MLTTKNSSGPFTFFLTVLVAVVLSGCMPAGPKNLLEGDNLLRQGKFAEAIAKFTNAIPALVKDADKARAWNGLGVAYHHSGDAPKAAAAYQQALKVNVDLIEARFNFGCLQLEQGNTALAVEAFTTYVMRQPNDAEGWMKLGQAQLKRAMQVTGRERSSQLDAAKKNLEQASKVNPTAECLNALGMVNFEKGRAADAVKLFDAALQRTPNYAPAILNLAILHHSSRDLNDRRLALKQYRQYLATGPANAAEVDAVARSLEAELSQKGGTPVSVTATDRSEAVRNSTNISSGLTGSRTSVARYKYISPPKPAAGNRVEANRFFNAALEAHKAKRIQEARDAYRKAIQADPSFFEAHYNLQLIEFDQGNLPAALNEAELALALTSGSVNARYNFALALDKSGYAQDAANELEKLLAQSPGETRAHLLLATLYAQKLGDTAKARLHFTKVLDLEPQHAQSAAIRNWLAANR